MRPGDLLLEAYPLTWPTDQARTPASGHDRGTFKVGFGVARDEMLRELARMGAKEIVLSTNVKVRRDCLPLADEREPSDPGVAATGALYKAAPQAAHERALGVRSGLPQLLQEGPYFEIRW